MSKARFGLKTRGEFTNCDGSSAVFGCSAQGIANFQADER
jgi:hypothetical protein